MSAFAFSTSWTPPLGSVPTGQMSEHSCQNEVSGLTRPRNAFSAISGRLIAIEMAWRTRLSANLSPALPAGSMFR